MIIIEYSFLTTPAKKFETTSDAVIIGRHSGENTVDLDLTPDVTASRRHAKVSFQANACWLEDLGSRGGTWVNEQRLTGRIRIAPLDHIRIGQTILKIRYTPSRKKDRPTLAIATPWTRKTAMTP
jgi:pSer/pThr/pTyr-binding forkhead associated (FHA) protein